MFSRGRPLNSASTSCRCSGVALIGPSASLLSSSNTSLWAAIPEAHAWAHKNWISLLSWPILPSSGLFSSHSSKVLSILTVRSILRLSRCKKPMISSICSSTERWRIPGKSIATWIRRWKVRKSDELTGSVVAQIRRTAILRAGPLAPSGRYSPLSSSEKSFSCPS